MLRNISVLQKKNWKIAFLNNSLEGLVLKGGGMSFLKYHLIMQWRIQTFR